MCGFGTLDFNDSLTRGGLLPAPGGDSHLVQASQKHSDLFGLLEEVAVKMKGKEEGKKFLMLSTIFPYMF